MMSQRFGVQTPALTTLHHPHQASPLRARRALAVTVAPRETSMITIAPVTVSIRRSGTGRTHTPFATRSPPRPEPRARASQAGAGPTGPVLDCPLASTGAH
jgi:hypothetical protein